MFVDEEIGLLLIFGGERADDGTTAVIQLPSFLPSYPTYTNHNCAGRDRSYGEAVVSKISICEGITEHATSSADDCRSEAVHELPEHSLNKITGRRRRGSQNFTNENSEGG
jgi:hypothetical protein